MKTEHKTTLVGNKEIARLLVMRTGMDENVVLTLLHFYERIILHRVVTGDTVRIDNLFTIYHTKSEIEIMLTEKAKKYIKRSRT